MKQRLLTELREYLFFSRKERRGILFLLILILLVYLFAQQLTNGMFNQSTVKFDSLKIKEVKFEAEEKELEYSHRNYYRREYDAERNSFVTSDQNAQFFEFDPNIAGSDEWRKLGVKESVVHTILKYREKGGRFREAEDLRKIFGLPHGLCERLIPYVRISESSTSASENSKYRGAKRQIVELNVNTASLEEWKQLEGIGDGYATRIIKYREKLGGFYSVHQVSETYGLPDSVFQKIKPKLVCSGAIQRYLDLNHSEVEELKIHPYIHINLAKSIVMFRNQHGPFQSVADIQKIATIDHTLFQKILPYLKIK